MAGELPPVVVQFEGDIEPLISQLREVADTLNEISAAGDSAQATIDALGDSAEDAAADFQGLAESARTAASTIRDGFAEDQGALYSLGEAIDDAALQFSDLADSARDAADEIRDGFAEDQGAIEALGTAADEATAEFDALGESGRDAADQIRDSMAEAAEAVGDLDSHLDDLAVHDGVLAGENEALAESLRSVRDSATEAGAGVEVLTRSEHKAAEAGFFTALSEGADQLTLMTGLIEMAIPAVLALGAALVVTGAVFGSFAALSVPAVIKVVDALKDTQKEIRKLPAPLRTVVEGIDKAKDSFEKMAKQFTPDVFKLIGIGLQMVNPLLKALGELAHAAVKPLDSIAEAMSKAVRSQDFKNLVAWLIKEFPIMLRLLEPLVVSIGKLAGAIIQLGAAIAPVVVPWLTKLVHALTDAFEWLSKHPAVAEWVSAILMLAGAITVAVVVVGALAGAFVALDAAGLPAILAIGLVGAAVAALIAGAIALAVFFGHLSTLKKNLHDIADAFDQVRHNVASLGDAFKTMGVRVGDATEHVYQLLRNWGYTVEHTIANAFDTARHTVASVASGIASDIRSSFDNARHSVAADFDGILQDIRSNLDTARHSAAAIVMGIVNDIRTDFDDARHDIAADFDDIRHTISSDFDTARHDVAATADGIVSDLAGDWDTVKDDATRAWDDVVNAVKLAWDRVRTAVSSGASDVLSFIRGLPGRIVSALGDLAGLLMGVGERAMQGLLSGIESGVGGIISFVEGVASKISGAFSKVLSIFSPSLVFYAHGRNIMLGLIAGMRSLEGEAVSTVSDIAGKVAAPSFPRAAQYGASGASGNVIVQVDGQALFSIMKADLYRYNVNNGGVATGQLIPR